MARTKDEEFATLSAGGSVAKRNNSGSNGGWTDKDRVANKNKVHEIGVPVSGVYTELGTGRSETDARGVGMGRRRSSDALGDEDRPSPVDTASIYPPVEVGKFGKVTELAELG